MTVSICPHCGEESGADESASGSEMLCGVCGKPFIFLPNQTPENPATVRAKAESKTATLLSWGCLILALGLLGGAIAFVRYLGTDHEDAALTAAHAERAEENRLLREERTTEALKLREEVLSHEWDHLFQEGGGKPSEITIDEKHGVSASPGSVSLNGTAMIDGVKHEFYFGFKREKDGSLAQDTFRLSKWEEYKPQQPGDVIGAWVAFQNAVEARLKSPSSAKFPFGGHRDVKHLGGGRYSVKSYVEAQNSFGATIRTNFSGTVVNDGGGWKLIALTLEE